MSISICEERENRRYVIYAEFIEFGQLLPSCCECAISLHESEFIIIPYLLVFYNIGSFNQ